MFALFIASLTKSRISAKIIIDQKPKNSNCLLKEYVEMKLK